MLLTLNDMPVGSLVKMCFKFPNGEITLDTVAKERETKEVNTLLCEYLLHEGKILKCSEGLCKVEIYNPDTKRTYCFRDIKAVNLKDEGLLLLSKSRVKPIENREAFRLSCGYGCDIRLKSHSGVTKGTVHDISYTGVSCIIPRDSTKPEIYEPTSISITDDYTKNLHKVTGHVVRIDEDYSDDKILVGVKIDNERSVQDIIGSIQKRALKTRDKR